MTTTAAAPAAAVPRPTAASTNHHHHHHLHNKEALNITHDKDKATQLLSERWIHQIHVLLDGIEVVAGDGSIVSAPPTDRSSWPLERQLTTWVLLLQITRAINNDVDVTTNNDEKDQDVQLRLVLLANLWKRHGSRLQDFALRILLVPPDNNDKDDKTMLILYLRLVAQVLTSMASLNSTEDDEEEEDLYPMIVGERILQVWQDLVMVPNKNEDENNKEDYPHLLLWMDVCTLAGIHFQKTSKRSTISKYLPGLFRYFLQEGKKMSLTRTTTTGSLSTFTKDAKHNNVRMVMKDTLTQILNRNHQYPRQLLPLSPTPFDDDDDNDNDSNFHSRQECLDQTMLQVLSIPTVMLSIPESMSRDVLTFVILDSGGGSSQGMWNQWCLEWFLSMLSTTASTTTTGGKKNAKGLLVSLIQSWRQEQQHINNKHGGRGVSSFSALHQWLLALAMIVTTTTTTESDTTRTVRAMAWQVVFGLTQQDWNWMMPHNDHYHHHNNNDTNTTKLGSAQYLCTWLRLASGELRIQLQQSRFLSSLSSSSDDDKIARAKNMDSAKKKEEEEENTTILEACCGILQGGVAHIISVAEHPPHISNRRSSPFTMEALGHLRQSLEATLWTTVEYLTLACRRQSSTSSSTDLPQHAATLMELLGSLLTEVDIFDLLHKEHAMITSDDDDNKGGEESSNSVVSSPQVILTCLQYVLPMARTSSLLPGMVHLLGSVDEVGEGEDPKLISLQRYLKDPLLQYLRWIWKDHQEQHAATPMHLSSLENDTTTQWAAMCTNLYTEVLDPTVTFDSLNQRLLSEGTARKV